jgi:RNA polymerase sigma-70 factor, ECF subfamily
MADRRGDFDRSALVHLGELLRVAIRVCGDRAAAEDLVQETYLQAWRSFDRFEVGTNCRAWLYKILFYVHWQRRRKVTREPRLLELDDAAESVLRFDPPTPDGLTASAVKAAFERLPEPFREVVMLTDVEELTYREAADVLGVPIGTIMSRVSRARRLLRHELAAVGSAYFEVRKAGHRDA